MAENSTAGSDCVAQIPWKLCRWNHLGIHKVYLQRCCWTAKQISFLDTCSLDWHTCPWHSDLLQTLH